MGPAFASAPAPPPARFNVQVLGRLSPSTPARLALSSPGDESTCQTLELTIADL
jgi:hypothetical protein